MLERLGSSSSARRVPARGDVAARTTFEGYVRDLTFLRALQQPTPATKILLIAMGVIFLGSYAVSALVVEPAFGELDSGLRPFLIFGAKVNASIVEGQWWRVVTHTFLHGGWLHLFLNGYALFLLGTIVERMYGTERMVIIYAASGVGGGLASFWFNDAVSVGASGAIFGIFGAAIVFGFKHRKLVPAQVAKALSTGLLPWLVLSLAFGLLPFVDNAAHFGGLGVGVVCAALLRSPLRGERPRWMRTALRIVVVSIIVASVASVMLAGDYARECVASEDAWKSCNAIVEQP